MERATIALQRWKENEIKNLIVLCIRSWQRQKQEQKNHSDSIGSIALLGWIKLKSAFLLLIIILFYLLKEKKSLIAAQMHKVELQV